MQKIKKRAFTLVELLIVMTTIAILIAIILMTSDGATDGATIAKIISDMRTAKTAIAIISLDKDKKNILLGDGSGNFTEWYEQGISIADAIAIETGTATPTLGTGELLAKHLSGKKNAGQYIYGSGTFDGDDILIIGKATFGAGTLDALKANKDILPNVFIFKAKFGSVEKIPDLENYTGTKVTSGTNSITDPESGYAIFMRVNN